MKSISFIKKTAIPYVVVITLLMLVMAFASTRYFENFVLENWKNELYAESQLAANQMLLSGRPLEAQGVADLVQVLATATGDRVTIILPDGQVIGESETDPASLENHLTRPEVQAALRGQTATAIRSSATLHTRLLYSASPVMQDGKIIAVVRLAKPITLIDATMAQYRKFILLVSAAGIILSLVLMFVQSGAKVNPLLRISQKVRDLSLGNLRKIEETNRQDEIGTIASSFNTMVEQIAVQVASIEGERAKNDAILSNMKDGVILVDEGGNVTLMNPAARELFQLDTATFSNNSLAEVVRHHQVLELWKQCQATQTVQSGFIQTTTAQESVQVTASPIRGNPSGDILLLFQDLTLLHKLQTVRQDFVSNVSHELRTPLTSLKLLVETLTDGAIKDEKQAGHFLQQMNMEIDNLTQIVQELLDLSKIESGRVPLNRTATDPRTLAEAAIERMRLQAGRAGIEIQTDLPENLPRVNADSSRIEQVIVNLLHNAIKFTNPGGRIKISAGIDGHSVLFSVEDNGIGISKNDLERIFERFYKTDRARASGGTGLGLSIARHIVESHGGSIWATSQPGKGSTFMFTIPRIR
jgi:two-component system phosphate regulon sensor histidine kinase PhoR